MGPVTVVTFHHTDLKKTKKKTTLILTLGKCTNSSCWSHRGSGHRHRLENMSSEGTPGICLNQWRQGGQQGSVSVQWPLGDKHNNTYKTTL